MKSADDSMTSDNYDSLKLDGMNAGSVLVSGSSNGIRLRYLITFVESDKHFVQVIFYSIQSKFDGLLEEFKKVRGTFKKVAAAETKGAK